MASTVGTSNSAREPRFRPTRKEVTLFYKTHRSQFEAPDRVHALHIVKNLNETTDETAILTVLKQAQEELSQGVPFAQVADKYSDCPGNGGDLGWFPQEVMVPEFDKIVFSMAPGETTPIFQTRFGFHIVHLVERRAAGIPPLSEVYEQIEDWLYRQRIGKGTNA